MRKMSGEMDEDILEFAVMKLDGAEVRCARVAGTSGPFRPVEDLEADEPVGKAGDSDGGDAAVAAKAAEAGELMDRFRVTRDANDWRAADTILRSDRRIFDEFSRRSAESWSAERQRAWTRPR
jgi:hypothetical protein